MILPSRGFDAAQKAKKPKTQVNMDKTKWLISWVIYDWATSAFFAAIQTFIFAAYFVKSVASNPTTGSAQWGFTNSIVAIIIALSSPILGAIADNSGRRKIWLGAFVLIAMSATACLWFVAPSPSYVPLALVLVSIAIIGSETAYVFYNAMLPELAPPNQIGRWSGWGWAAGYAGGMTFLLLALIFIYHGPSTDKTMQTRILFLLVALWHGLFSLPLFIFTPSKNGQNKPPLTAIQDGLKSLALTIKNIRRYSVIAQFLFARMFYLDGLTTLFIFGGVYGAVTFGMNEAEILTFAITLNLSSGIGAALLAFLDDWIGSRKLILISIVGLIIPTTIILFVTDMKLFWILGMCVGIFVGPVQSASRSLLARLAPEHMRNEMFGFFALSGKATAFLGPTLVSWTMLYTGSQRLGLSVVVFFFLLGGLLMLLIPEQKIASQRS